MSKALLTNRQEEILALLTRNPDGLNCERIRNGLKNPPHLRTVQRSLAELVTGRHIAAVGNGKATVYTLLTSSGVPDLGRRVYQRGLIPLAPAVRSRLWAP
jgi:hypothetical protein